MRVGFIGAGRMGRPMVDRLVIAGHDVRVLGRTPRARDALRAAGAVPVADAADAATSADVVCVCVYSDDQVSDVCLKSALLARMPPGSVLVIHTTGSPRTVQAIAATDSAAGRGIGALDAPVSGGSHDIAAGHITLFVGGTADVVERATPALSAYGGPILHLGPLGAGQGVKLVNNAVFAANIGLLAEAVRLGEQFGVTERDLLQALTHGSGASRALAGAAARGSVEGFASGIREFLGKDIAVVREAVAELGSGLGVIDDAFSVLDG